MPAIEIVASTENTGYQMWQAMLFHFSCVRYQGQVPTIVVHHSGEPLLTGFRLIEKLGGRIQAAPNYRAHQGVSYPPRNTAGTLRHVSTAADFIFLCDPDMIFLRHIPLEDFVVARDEISFDKVSYIVPDKAEFAGQLESICQEAGVSYDMLLERPVSGGVPHMIPAHLREAVSTDWLDVMEHFPTFRLGPEIERPHELREVPNQFWTTTMWALVLTLHRLRLNPVLTQHCLHNLHGELPLPTSISDSQGPGIIHYCYRHPGFDKRKYFDAEAIQRTVWNLPPDDGTISGAIRGQLHEARDF
ncbi:MAG: hypothetical protein JSS02_11150, partial [Planctomycetes bacterium]|nr:hypothetical protein [Planctomycetota bacterium]